MREWIDSLSDIQWWGLEADLLFYAGAVLILSWVVGMIARFLLHRSESFWKQRQREVIGSVFGALSSGAVALAVVIGFGIAVSVLNLDGGHREQLITVTRVAWVVVISYLAYLLVDVPVTAVKRYALKKDDSFGNFLGPLISRTLSVAVIFLAIAQIYQIITDQPMTTILAGLGVGGIAVGLAAQDAIGNFFGSIMLATDRPFEVGDRVVVDSYDGPIEKVGLRSTQIRTLEGHLVSIPNKYLASTSIQNIAKRPHIRRLSTITVTYDTPPDKMREAVSILQDILKDHEGMHEDYPPRVYFSGYGDWALEIMMIYWYHPPSYWDYMAFSEKVNLEILERFNKAGLEFAFPSQTIYTKSLDHPGENGGEGANKTLFVKEVSPSGHSGDNPKADAETGDDAAAENS